MATATIKRSPVPATKSDTKQRHRIANEATLATGCRLRVEFEPSTHLTPEGVLPAKRRPSRGHVFSVKFVAPDDLGHPLALDAILDDRDGDLCDLLAVHLRGLAGEFSQLADEVETARRGRGVQ